MERDAALRGNWKQEPSDEGGPGKEETYWLRNKLRSAVVHLRDIEDYYIVRGGTPESPNVQRARRARGIYEQISEDYINGKLGTPTMRERAESAEAEVRQLRDGLRRELDYISTRIASFTPHGMDSTRVGDYHFTADLTRAVDRARALLSASQDAKETA